MRSPTGAPGAAQRVHARCREPRRRWPINHQGQFPAVTLSFNLAPGRLARRGRRRDRARRARARPAAPASAPSFQGTAQAFQASLANEPLLILAALVTVYIVLGVLYESYIHPITILSTLPSAGVGALLALCSAGTELERHRADRHHPADRHREEERDHDDRLRARGRARARASRPREAIYEACLLRFRPIMMTTMAALLGGAAAGARHAAPARSCAGRSASRSSAACSSRQLLTLYTTPVDLPRLRPARRAGCAPRPRRRAARRSTPGGLSADADEHLRALHPPARRHDAARRVALAAGRLRRPTRCCRWRRCRRSTSRPSRSAPACPARARRRWPRRSRRRSSGSSAASPASPR